MALTDHYFGRGFSRGLRQGLVQGRAEALRAVALRLLQSGLEEDYVADMTTLSGEDINRLVEENN